MTCKGYDPKAVKIGKPVKTLAATIMDRHQRGAFIRSYVAIAEAEASQRTNRNSRKDKK
jgi:hypothetical protein